MEEATMSQHAEMTATDNLEAAELSGTPTQSVKKPSRFSADAFRALSDRLNGTPALTPPPETVHQSEPPEQIIPELAPELTPALDVVPSVEVSIQPIPAIAAPADSIVNGVEPVAVALPIPEMVVEALAPDVAAMPDVVSVLDVVSTPDVLAVQDSVENGIPQFVIPQVEIPNFSMPPAHDVVQPVEAVEVLQEQVSADLSPIEQVITEPAPLGNTAEPDFLDLEQFTQAAPSSDLAPTDQVLHDVEPLKQTVQPSATNVGSLSLAEMLAAEPQEGASQTNVVVQETQAIEPAIAPVVIETFEEVPNEQAEEVVVQAAALAPQVDVNQIVEPVTEPLAAPIETPVSEVSSEALPDALTVQAEPSLNDSFTNQVQPENPQSVFSVPEQEVAPDTVPQDIQAAITEPVAIEYETLVQTEPVLENELDMEQQEIAPVVSPPIDSMPAAIPSFSPQGGLDPLLEAMRLMQEVGPAPSPEAEVVEQVQDKKLVGKSHDLNKTETKTASDLLVEVAPTKVAPTKVATAKISPNKVPSAKPTDLAEENAEPEYELELEPDEKSGETARALLDMMSGAGGAAQPQERALAGDTLLQLVPRMPEKDLISLSERVGMMDEPPALLVNKLINNRSARVAQPLLEGGQVVGDQDLLKLITKCEVDRLTMISKRRIISSGVCDALIGRGEASVYLTLVRNPGASISHDAFISLCEIAKNQQTLQAPLATRGDTPPPIAFELFWSLPVELRRYVLSRFLTDSATLDKILKIAQSMGSDTGVDAAGDQHFPTRRKVDDLVDLIAEGVVDEAVESLAKLADIQLDNARRIITDPDGEPLTVALKTLGISRAKFNNAIKLFSTSPSAPLSAERDLQELQAMFDGLSHNKARTLMKYWDWAVEKSGPYARRSA